ELLTNYEPVKDSDLKYQKVDGDFAEDYREALVSSEEKMNELAENSSDEEFQSDYEQTADLLESSGESILQSNVLGIDHYKKYFQVERMWLSLGNTTFFTVVSVAFELVLGMLIALLINRAFKGRGLIRASVLIPWAVPTAVAAMMWGFLYDGQSGI